MKKFATVFPAILFLSLLCCCSLNKVDGTHRYILFDNTSEYYLYVCPFRMKYGDCDTLDRNYSAFGQEKYRVPPGTSNTAALRLYRGNTYESTMRHYDYLSVFIWNKDNVSEINGAYFGSIIARYDLTLDNLFLLDWEISFPPDERMKDIHMYPPYQEIIERYGNN